MSEFASWYGPGGTGSGDGSSVTYTEGYRSFLEAFMREHKIQSVLDLGCGDWQSSQFIDWGTASYTGVDEVPALIDRLNASYSGAGVCRRFRHSDAWHSRDADLLICKDVVMHLPNDEVSEMCAHFVRYDHALITYDFAEPPNADCERGGYRALDMTAPPFNLVGEIVYRFPRLHNETKVVLHVHG